MGPTFGGVTRALAAVAALLPAASAVPFGLQIYGCTKPGVIAPGFDDGPWIYSEDILDRMGAAGFTATWFINGANKGNIYDYNSTLRRMINMGHQIGSHTWSHKDLATLTADGVRQEMLLLEEAMVNILGYFPYYMRPPFLSVNAQALAVLKELQYHVIIGDLNTKDWEYQTEAGIEIAKKLFTDGLDTGYTIVESHEQEAWSHGVLIDYMIKVVKDRGLKTVTVAECLQDTQIYRTVRDPNTTVDTDPEPTVVYSLNGRCGNINAGNNLGWTCPPNGGRCCSKWGNCGSGSDYCAASICQPAFGLCDAATSTFRDEASQSNTATVIPSRTVSNTETLVTSTSTSSKAATTSLGPGSTTPDNTCGYQNSGKDKGYVCKTGACCSKYGNCGTTTDYCAASVCQSAFGKCDPAPGRGSVTPDGTCGDSGKGANNGYVCKTGMCCSKYGNCGSTSDYCAATSGCQSAFGNCTGVISSSSLSTSKPVTVSSSLPTSSQNAVVGTSAVSSASVVASSSSSVAAIVSSSSAGVLSSSIATSSSIIASTSSAVSSSVSAVVSISASVTPSSSAPLAQEPLLTTSSASSSVASSSALVSTSSALSSSSGSSLASSVAPTSSTEIISSSSSGQPIAELIRASATSSVATSSSDTVTITSPSSISTTETASSSSSDASISSSVPPSSTSAADVTSSSLSASESTRSSDPSSTPASSSSSGPSGSAVASISVATSISAEPTTSLESSSPMPLSGSSSSVVTSDSTIAAVSTEVPSSVTEVQSSITEAASSIVSTQSGSCVLSSVSGTSFISCSSTSSASSSSSTSSVAP